ncbi:MAG: N-acetyltransferase DgcN [Steroidobacter sp.]
MSTQATEFAVQPPYLLFLADVTDIADAKTAAGIHQWRGELCAGQLRLPGCTVDLGLPDLTPVAAVSRGIKTMIIGIANDGGFIAEHWITSIVSALEAGLDVASGLHERLRDVPAIASAAERSGRHLIEVRQPENVFKPGTGRKRSGKRLLTVGTDCAVGKKYTALAIEKELRARGVKADFRATGQTGIFISGRGVAVDSIIADFVSGAAEWLSPENTSDHWDVIEGQGSLFHPAYAGVTLGLVHGSQPDAMVICHDPRRSTLMGYEDFPIVDFRTCADAYLAAARLTNPNARVVGISLNTSHLKDKRQARKLLEKTTRETSLPCCDPIRLGVGEIIDNLLRPSPR